MLDTIFQSFSALIVFLDCGIFFFSCLHYQPLGISVYLCAFLFYNISLTAQRDSNMLRWRLFFSRSFIFVLFSFQLLWLPLLPFFQFQRLHLPISVRYPKPWHEIQLSEWVSGYMCAVESTLFTTIFIFPIKAPQLCSFVCHSTFHVNNICFLMSSHALAKCSISRIALYLLGPHNNSSNSLALSKVNEKSK